jgi:hypothetical protein
MHDWRTEDVLPGVHARTVKPACLHGPDAVLPVTMQNVHHVPRLQHLRTQRDAYASARARSRPPCEISTPRAYGGVPGREGGVYMTYLDAPVYIYGASMYITAYLTGGGAP